MSEKTEQKFYWTMPDGTVWDMDARIIAEDRASHYAVRVDGYKPDSPEWQAEVEYALKHPDELEDWAKNNMDWADMQAHLVAAPHATDYSLLFAEAVGSASFGEALDARP